MTFLFQLLATLFLSGYVENPHHSALEYSLERGGSTDISRAARNGVYYLLLISIVSLVILLITTQKSGMKIGSK